jgi:hypothetical protein
MVCPMRNSIKERGGKGRRDERDEVEGRGEEGK